MVFVMMVLKTLKARAVAALPTVSKIQTKPHRILVELAMTSPKTTRTIAITLIAKKPQQRKPH